MAPGVLLRPPMPDLASLRARLDALPVDRAPLRRAGLLTLLLVALLVVTQAIRPDVRPASEMLERQDVHAGAERVSAPTGVSAGRLGAVLLLAVGGGLAFWLRRRHPASGPSAEAAIEVLETHPLGPNHSLRLVACGDEILLLDVSAEGARLLRQWPRATFGAESASMSSSVATVPVAVQPAVPEAAPEVVVHEAAVPEAVAVPETPSEAARSTMPHQFGTASPSFADVLAQFAPARA